MIIHIFVDTAIFSNLPEEAITISLGLEIEGRNFDLCSPLDNAIASFHKTIHVPLTTDVTKTSELIIRTKSFSVDGVSQVHGQGICCISPVEHGASKAIHIHDGNSTSGKVTFTIFYYKFPMDIGDFKENKTTAVTRQDQYVKEFAFLQSRRMRWSGKRPSSFNKTSERLLSEDIAVKVNREFEEFNNKDPKFRPQNVPKKNVPKKAWPSTQSYRLRKTTLSVSYGGTDRPSYSVRQEEKIRYKLQLAEEKRLSLLKDTAKKVRLRNVQLNEKIESIHQKKEYIGKQKEMQLRRLLQKKEASLMRLRAELIEQQKIHNRSSISPTRTQRRSTPARSRCRSRSAAPAPSTNGNGNVSVTCRRHHGSSKNKDQDHAPTLAVHHRPNRNRLRGSTPVSHSYSYRSVPTTATANRLASHSNKITKSQARARTRNTTLEAQSSKAANHVGIKAPVPKQTRMSRKRQSGSRKAGTTHRHKHDHDHSLSISRDAVTGGTSRGLRNNHNSNNNNNNLKVTHMHLAHNHSGSSYDGHEVSTDTSTSLSSSTSTSEATLGLGLTKSSSSCNSSSSSSDILSLLNNCHKEVSGLDDMMADVDASNLSVLDIIRRAQNSNTTDALLHLYSESSDDINMSRECCEDINRSTLNAIINKYSCPGAVDAANLGSRLGFL